MARAYRMTSARRAAIRKAQLASARKRRGKKRRQIATGVGVLAVTMAAAGGAAHYRRKRGASKSVNVVQETLRPTETLSTSKEIDVLRNYIEESIVTQKNGSSKIDFGRVGRPRAHGVDKNLHVNQRQLDRKQNKQTKGKGVTRTDRHGKTDHVLRNRPGFNDSRRNEYRPSSRRQRYQENKSRDQVPRWLTPEHRAMKRTQKRTKALTTHIATTIFNNGNRITGHYDPFNLVDRKKL